MAKGNAIAAAVLASAGNPGTGGSGPAVAGGLSPLVASYTQSYSVNRPYSPLPRPASVFLDGAFGPFSPITAMPIDPPREDTHRPDARRFEYRVGYNLPVGQVGEQDKLVPFPVLRSLADNYSVARSCVDKRKAEIVGLEWDIVPTPEAEHAMMGDDKLRTDWESRRAKVVEFFSHPDSDRAKYPTFGSWLSAILEDRFVIDAVAIHLVPPRKKGGGPFGSDLAALNVLDGQTVRPLLSTLGETPPSPSVAFEQYIWGIPRVDLISVINGTDKEELGEPVADFRADQLIYMRETPRAFTPFGYSAIEKAFLPISIGLARQQWQSTYFTDGSVPALFVVPGPDISTPQQIRQLQDALNGWAGSGDIGAKHRIIVFPPGTKADPMKPAPLADQFDEWIISQVTMPFGLTPMDLGVTPRVSAVQSPSESKELSQINSDKGAQTRVEPVCSDLKSVIFDFVIRECFRQRDMEWSWGITDRGKNRAAAIQEHVQLIGNGIESIDEARTDLGNTPWGLPETSVPLIITPTGPVPVSVLAEATPQSDLALHSFQPGAPAGSQQKPGPQGALPQAPRGKDARPGDDELTTPAHEAAGDLPDTPGGGKGRPGGKGGKPAGGDEPGKAAKRAAELEILARYLRKGRDPSRFRAEHLPPEAVGAAVRAFPSGAEAAVKAASDAAEARRRQERRDRKVEAAAAVVAAGLGRKVREYRDGKAALPQVVDHGVAVMAAGYRSAMRDGSSDAADDYEDTPETDGAAVDDAADSEAEGQRGYLTGLVQDVAAGLSAKMIAYRLALFAATLRKVYNRAYGTTVTTAHPEYEIIWELGDNSDHCPPCVARDGKSFTVKSLPGWPGDGGFGGAGSGAAAALGQENICEGGPRCCCSVRFVQNGQTVATGSNTQLPGATDYYAQQNRSITAARQEAAANRQAFVDSLPQGPGTRAMTRDQLRRQVADAANARIRASGGYSGVSVEPEDVPAKIIAQMLPPGQQGAAGLSSPRLDVPGAVDAMFAAKGHRLDMTRAEFAAIVGAALDEVMKDAADLSDPTPVDAEHVYQQLLENYKPKGIAWVRSCTWIGPVNVPLDRVDTSAESTWAASHPGGNAAHVRRFARRIGDGGDVNPVVMVQVRGQDKLKVVDGHHRYEAFARLGRPVKAYIGFTGDDSPEAPWALTHLYQLHSGGDPMNKQAAAEDPTRVAFLLIRAPNENGKWRYLLQKRDDGASHGGTWGLPGGKTLEGESPWDAAVRESAEELGDLPAVRPAAAWTRAEDGRVVWTYLVDAPAMWNPGPGAEAEGETAGWAWFRRKDVPGLELHPAFRRTWERLDFGEPLLGGDKPGTAKAARGYELNARSGMISLDLPGGLIEPVPGGVSDHHITVVYLGGDVDDAAFAEACRRAAQAAAAVPGPLTGVISGRGTFEPSASSDGKIPVWAGVTLPGGGQLRAALEDLSASEHPEWHPHVTRLYADPGGDLPGPLPAIPVTFTHLSVHRGDDEVARFPFGG